MLHGRRHIDKIISLLVIPYQMQDLRIHCPSDCWLFSYFFSVVRLLDTLMAIHNPHSSSKVNHKVWFRPRLHYFRLSLPPRRRRRPQCLLLLVFVLCRCVRQPCSYCFFHCGFVSRFFSAVYLYPVQMGPILQHIAIRFYCYFFVYTVYLISCSRLRPEIAE